MSEEITDAERLTELEKMIAAAKQSISAGGSPVDMRQVQVLRLCAADVRARLPGAGGAALATLEYRVQRVKGSIQNDPAALSALGQVVIHHWPEIRAALVDLTVSNARRPG